MDWAAMLYMAVAHTNGGNTEMYEAEMNRMRLQADREEYVGERSEPPGDPPPPAHRLTAPPTHRHRVRDHRPDAGLTVRLGSPPHT